jgi:hypothetical protein
MFTKKMKYSLISNITEMNGIIIDDRDVLDDMVTHLIWFFFFIKISPPHSKTIKTLEAILKNKWICSPKWIIDSKKNNIFLSEENYGFKRFFYIIISYIY